MERKIAPAGAANRAIQLTIAKLESTGSAQSEIEAPTSEPSAVHLK
jgi:hypothetical protein